MITTNIIQRVFFVKFPGGEGHGTCFTIEVDQRQYLITAKHLAGNIQGHSELSVFHDKEWKSISVALIGHCGCDISVLAANFQLSPVFPAIPSWAGLVYGQDTYFLGFPYLEEDIQFQKINRGFPMPFVKKGIVSCTSGSQIFLDGHNNPGFSGGPMVFKEADKPDYKIGGVVSGYRTRKNPVMDSGRIPSYAHVSENTGIVVAENIKSAVDVIQSHPHGFLVEG